VKPNLAKAVALLALAGISPARPAIAVTPVSPLPLWIHAQFYPGGDPSSHPWELTITGSGNALQQTFVFSTSGPTRTKTISKSFALSRQDLAELLSVVKDARFFELPAEISETGLAHYATLELRIVTGNKTHTSSFLAPNQKENPAALTRFWKVWSAVLKKIPSPNRNQDLHFWMRRVHPELLHSAKS